MAGVGEVSAIVNLIVTAVTLSQAIIDVSCRYKHAREQIESFGREVGLFGQILDQFRKLPAEAKQNSTSVKLLIDQIVNECSVIFSQLDAFNEGMHSNSKPPGPQNVSRRGKANSGVEDALRDHAESIAKLSVQSNVCTKRLQTLENEGAHVEEDTRDNISTSISIATVDTAASAQSNSTLESIYRAYGWKPHQTEPSAATDHNYDTNTSADPGFDLKYLESRSRQKPYSKPLINDFGRISWDQDSMVWEAAMQHSSAVRGTDTPKAALLDLDLEPGDDMLQEIKRIRECISTPTAMEPARFTTELHHYNS